MAVAQAEVPIGGCRQGKMRFTAKGTDDGALSAAVTRLHDGVLKLGAVGSTGGAGILRQPRSRPPRQHHVRPGGACMGSVFVLAFVLGFRAGIVSWHVTTHSVEQATATPHG